MAIYHRFGVRYSLSGGWYLVQRLGWSNQPMPRGAVQRDEATIADWQATVWPTGKQVA